ncbi:PREDICTED: apoptotic chromatin condensation inducer in the nucleus-like [Calidris pugnax]|uniref:apoptotic chromatin condensation inducer in the nucleus-like n=1 Tax=Calidris pugnax TaxID=198806 RepID=UPI00071C2E33|nr:PREDICTED: apoptotic chromatin condensation inducer in the nucleus-like [Calidris pugnax]
MLENLQKHSSPHGTFQPNSQIGEEMSQNSFIKQYLEKQQELLQQRLEREAREPQATAGKGEEEEEEEEGGRRTEPRGARPRQVKTTGGLGGIRGVLGHFAIFEGGE